MSHCEQHAYCAAVEFVAHPYAELGETGLRERSGRLHAVAVPAATPASGSGQGAPAPQALCGWSPAADAIRPDRAWSSVTPAGRCRECDLAVARALLSTPDSDDALLISAREEAGLLGRLVDATRQEGDGPLGPIVLDLLLGCPVAPERVSVPFQRTPHHLAVDTRLAV